MHSTSYPHSSKRRCPSSGKWARLSWEYGYRIRVSSETQSWWKWAKRVGGVASGAVWIVGLAGLPEDWDRWVNEWLPALPGVLNNPNVTAPLGALAIIWAYDEVWTRRRRHKQPIEREAVKLVPSSDSNSQTKLAQLVPDILEARDEAEEGRAEAIAKCVRLAYHLRERFDIPCPYSPGNIDELDEWYWLLSHLLPRAELEDIDGARTLSEEEPWA